MRQQLLDADAIGEGLIYHKAPLSQRKLVSKLAAAGFVLYPTSRAEASVAHVARAMLMGCIPISSRTPYSALNETTWPFDLGPEPPPGVGEEQVRADGGVDIVRIEHDPAWLSRWAQVRDAPGVCVMLLARMRPMMILIEHDPAWLSRWAQAVVGAALADPARLADHRAKMVEASRQRFDHTPRVPALTRLECQL